MRPEPGTPRPNAVLRVSVLCSPCTELLTNTTCSSRSTALTISEVDDSVSTPMGSDNADEVERQIKTPSTRMIAISAATTSTNTSIFDFFDPNTSSSVDRGER